MNWTRAAATVLVSGAVLGSGLVAGGCAATWSDMGLGMVRSERTDERAIEHVAGMPVYVRTRNGSITIRTGQGPKASIEAKLSAKDDAALAGITLSAERDAAGVLNVIANWPRGSKGEEACSITITLPDAKGVDLETSNGAITFGGLTGMAEAESSNGSITVTSHAGDVRVETSNGAISAEGVTGRLMAETSNGRIQAKAIGGSVSVESSNGAIDIGLTDANPGPIRAETSNSSITLRVGSGFAGELDAKSSNGSVKWTGASGVVRTGTNNRAKLVFPAKGEASKIETSNGSITIEQK